MDFKPFYGTLPQWLLWAGSRAAWDKITLTGVTNRLNDFVIFIVYT
jgi:hypothetical protein